MADPRQSGPPGPVPQAGPAPQAEPVRSPYRPLRLIIIVLILAGAAFAGFHFKSAADPATEPASFSSQPPQYVNVYESNTNLKITVTVTLGQGFFNVNYDRYGPVKLRPQGYTDFAERVDFTATQTGNGPPGAIIISASTRPQAAADDSVYGSSSVGGTVAVLPVKGGVQGGDVGQADKYAVWFALSSDLGHSWSGTALFDPVPLIYQDHGSTFGHLPSVGAYSYLYPPLAVLMGEYDTATGRPRAVSFSPPKISAGEREEDFAVPNYQASYSEVVEQIVPALSNTETAYMNPATSSANDSDYEWQANSIDGLAPTFKAVDLGAGDAQSQAAFYSGIGFGVAGSALIALVQEIPAERRNRGTRPPPLTAASDPR